MEELSTLIKMIIHAKNSMYSMNEDFVVSFLMEYLDVYAAEL